MTLISCVSGTYNRLLLLRRMVQSVRKSIASAESQLDHELILVDGNSTDGTKEWCRQQSDIILIEHPGLLGSAKAYQDGFERAKGEYVVTLNDDISVESPSIPSALRYLEKHPEAGQVAFGHKYQRRRGGKIKNKPIIQKIFGGYIYAQCGMTRRWLGEAAGWTGKDVEGYIYYGWDNYLSARIWELGWEVVSVPSCAVIDWEHEDELREISSEAPRQGGGRNAHPDAVRFAKHWRNRLPSRDEWIPAVKTSVPLERRILDKAAAGTLRTLRFKGMMYPKSKMRMACIQAFGKYGSSRQVNQTERVGNLGLQKYQDWVLQVVRGFKPDLIMLQAQRMNNIFPQTVKQIRKRYPNTFVFNWDGDTHYPLRPFNIEIAKACHLQLVVSPTLFSDYIQSGALNVGYWPIGVEPEFLSVNRPSHPQEIDGPDVIFLGALYGIGMFPEAETRRDAVKRLLKSKLDFKLYGNGWQQIGIQAKYTGERFHDNAVLYTNSKMALSISQASDLWGYTSDRLYNICGTGCPALVQRFAGMEEHGFTNGVSCIAWTTFDEMLQKAHYYLRPEHEEEREEIGRRGRELVVTRHNWDERVERFWSMLWPHLYL